jgi:hypothetical protein
VNVVDGIFGISWITELDKTESVFDRDFTEAPIVLEEVLDVSIRCISGEMAQIHTGSHVGCAVLFPGGCDEKSVQSRNTGEGEMS